MVARELPDLFHVACDRLVAMVDAEAVLGLGCSPATQRIEEPVGSHHVLPGDSQHVPPAGQDLVSGADQPSHVVCWDGVQDSGGKGRLEARGLGQLRLRPISIPRQAGQVPRRRRCGRNLPQSARLSAGGHRRTATRPPAVTCTAGDARTTARRALLPAVLGVR